MKSIEEIRAEIKATDIQINAVHVTLIKLLADIDCVALTKNDISNLLYALVELKNYKKALEWVL